ncbi:MAG: DEAD/DEAH box helicase, partial [candidate division WS1 bacterium]|nr:DEAD/DEAH box helicase [candidate division WS1 bacterium]
RLLHGDVGAGKTAVAGAALLAVARAGRQAALMAPTELLAEQHYRVLADWLRDLGWSVHLLIGSSASGEAAATRKALSGGEAQIVIGTHALFQRGVHFHDLALVVVDEQHRFGVRQRAELAGKGLAPNLLVMSATPIPRTLALTAYGDFDVSVLDELPPGRQPVHTQVLGKRERRRAYESLVQHVSAGRRAFVVCPVIEEGAREYVASAQEVFERLQEQVPALRWGLVHGRMKREEREAAMNEFRQGALDVLVATSVVEVGVDVPEAAMMIVENAECFGLAQLHQLRGRVARARTPASCYLITISQNPDTIERLQVLERTTDGFIIAQEDLLRRGPGELLGERQSGYLDVRLAQAASDTRLLVQARKQALALLEEDPELQAAEHQALAAYLRRAEARTGGFTL